MIIDYGVRVGEISLRLFWFMQDKLLFFKSGVPEFRVVYGICRDPTFIVDKIFPISNHDEVSGYCAMPK